MTSLRQRMLEDMQIRNLAVNTQESYIQQVALFARHFSKSPELLGPEQIRAYQVYLTTEKKLAPGSITTVVAALRFLYKVTLKKTWSQQEIIPAPKKPQTLPVVLSPEEVIQFLGAVASIKHRAILTTCYGQAYASLRRLRSNLLQSTASAWSCAWNRVKARRIVMSCFHRSSLRSCEIGGEWSGLNTGFSQMICRVGTSPDSPLNTHVKRPTASVRFPNQSPRTRCVTIPCPGLLPSDGGGSGVQARVY